MKLYNTYTKWSTLANNRWIRVPIINKIYAVYIYDNLYDNRYEYSILFLHINYAIPLQVEAVPIPNNTSIQQLPIGRNI